ncbi:MAG: efflux RND transporter periplasmic adaptor subunit [Rhodocyclaceae bacterium]|nr:efflux RND transporter periplasmic adaptor subunit [Rhodocyclaceae bacterium]
MNKSALLIACLMLAACGEKLPPPDAASSGPKLVKAMTVGAGPSQADVSPPVGGSEPGLRAWGGNKVGADSSSNQTASENRYSGEVRARYESQLAFRVGGKIVARLVDAGARVKAGQPLARLDPADLQLTAVQAEANRSLAAAELQRTQELKAKNFVSQAALDAKVSTAQSATAQAQLAKNQADYTTLVADTTGVVVAVLAEPGQVVAAGQGVFRVARDGEREVAINLPEAHIAGLKVGAGGTAQLWADGTDKVYRGVLRELAPAADPATRTFAARVTLDAAPADLPLGLTATVSFARQEKQPLVVPLAALLQQGAGERGAAVWVIGADRTVSQRAVEIERYSDAGAVLKSGLNAGEQIVAAGAFKLVAGEKVRIAAP